MILSAWWVMRIKTDAQRGSVDLNDYLDELLTDDERLERSAARLAAYFDALIEGGEIKQQ